MHRIRLTIGLGFLLLLALLGSAVGKNAAEMREKVTVTLTPHNPYLTIPAEGGNFAYNVEVGNGEAASLIFDVWTTCTLPDGGGDAAGYGPVYLLLPGGWSAQEDLSQMISGGMPDGMYTYTAYAGIYPDEVWSSDSFEFEKLPGTAGWYALSPEVENGLSSGSSGPPTRRITTHR